MPELKLLNTPRGWVGLSLLLNVPLAVWGFQRQAFDSYVHIFFASHYQRTWFETWEPRWYVGFSVTSYPPLVHQLIALLAWPLEFVIQRFTPSAEQFPGAHNFLSLEIALVLVLLMVLCGWPLAVHTWARIFVGPRAASWAARLSVFLPALSLTGWAFGQLPTLAATTVLLFALARGAEYLRTGKMLALIQAALLAALTAALHHGVFLFVPLAGAALLPLPFRERAGVRVRFMRLGAWAALSALLVAAVLWPFLLWSSGQGLQTPIDHPSRYNFFESAHATYFFFWPVHGPLLLLIPPTLWLTWKHKKFWPLTLAWAALFVLSLGGTTPLPRWLFGAGWEWLTYDRFGLWASVAFAPLAGTLLLAWQRTPRGLVAAKILLTSLALTSTLSASLCVLTQCQPPTVNLAPLVQFLNEPEQKPFRYFTLGFGDQLAKLSTLASNGTPDGTYHTARQLPELRASGLGALDTALWNPHGVWALKPFLEQSQKYGARWAFVNHAAYAPVLRATGWRYRFDVGAVQAWERADVQPLVIEPPPQNQWAALWWGTAPLAVLLLSGVALVWRVRLSRAQVVAGLNALRLGLLALTLVMLNFWWVWPARPAQVDLPRIYFFYESVLVFASDVTLALTLGIWIITLALQKTRPRVPHFPFLLLFLCSLLFSTFNSPDSGLTLATTLHWGLLAGLFVMLVNHPPAPPWLALMFSAFTLTQAAWALLQIFTQSTAVPADWPFLWPGFITAAQPGASVVQNAEGLRWLRAYGTLPHPNLLGAMVLVFLGMASANYSRPRKSATLFLIVASAVISLTFSRAAWLGLTGGVLAAYFFAPREFRLQAKRAVFICAATVALVLLPLSSFVFSRAGVSGQENRLEFASTLERTLLIQYGVQAWQASPLTGVGAGGFVQWAAQNTGADLPFEPVHNVPLLLLAETGLVGAGAALALLGAIAVKIWRRRTVMSAPEAVYAATLVGVAVTMQFDHLWWTQPPARTLLVFLLGLWAAHSYSRPPVPPP